MKTTEERYQEVLKKSKSIDEEIQRDKGALATLKAQLQEQFGFDDPVSAKKHLEELQTKSDKLEAEMKSKIEEFEKEYGDNGD